MNDITIRWILRADMDDIMNIESLGYESPWSEDDMLAALAQRNMIGLLAEKADDAGSWGVLGFVLYELRKGCLEIINVCVHPRARRQGIGLKIMNHLSKKMQITQRSRLVANVSDRNLSAHLFFSACGFRAVSVNNNSYKFVFRSGVDQMPKVLLNE